MRRKMTNEKAINLLKDMQSRCTNGYVAEAINIAIMALESPTVPTVPNEYMRGYEAAEREYKRPTGEWIVTAEDNDGVHRIQCPFCGYEKGSNFVDVITVIFESMPKFCENCGAKMKGEEE